MATHRRRVVPPPAPGPRCRSRRQHALTAQILGQIAEQRAAHALATRAYRGADTADRLVRGQLSPRRERRAIEVVFELALHRLIRRAVHLLVPQEVEDLAVLHRRAEERLGSRPQLSGQLQILALHGL